MYHSLWKLTYWKMKRIITAFLCIACAFAGISAQNKALLTGKVSGSDGEILTGAAIVAGGADIRFQIIMDGIPLK